MDEFRVQIVVLNKADTSAQSENLGDCVKILIFAS